MCKSEVKQPFARDQHGEKGARCYSPYNGKKNVDISEILKVAPHHRLRILGSRRKKVITAQSHIRPLLPAASR
jgi:hypothetical protein